MARTSQWSTKPWFSTNLNFSGIQTLQGKSWRRAVFLLFPSSIPGLTSPSSFDLAPYPQHLNVLKPLPSFSFKLVLKIQLSSNNPPPNHSQLNLKKFLNSQPLLFHLLLILQTVTPLKWISAKVTYNLHDRKCNGCV